MIASIEIRNFRCFAKLQASNLGQFSVLVGPNGSGKTAFLEAIFLACGGSPEIYLRTRAWRGIGEDGVAVGSRQDYEALWRDLFFNMNAESGASVLISDPDRGDRSLAIRYPDDPREQVLDFGVSRSQKGQSSERLPITFEWSLPSGKKFSSAVERTPDGLRTKVSDDTYPAIFLLGTSHSPSAIAQRFSELSRRKQHERVVEAVRTLFPEVEDLSVEILAGNNVLHASVRGISERIPLGALSAGVNKYASILLAIAAQPGGVVIVDEVENGLYYRMLERAWEGIVRFAMRENVQLFVSTHSGEFLSSMLPAVDDNEDLYSFLQLSRKESESILRVFDGHHLKSALEQAVEVR